MLFAPKSALYTQNLFFQSRSLTQNVSFSVDAKPAVDDYKKLYHKHYKLTIRLWKKEGEKKNEFRWKSISSNMRRKKNLKAKTRKKAKAISCANICLYLRKL